MDKLTTTLLTGAAMSALAVVPAMAHQARHLPPQFANMKPHHTKIAGIAHLNAQGKVELVTLKGHQKTVHPKGGGVTFYTTYTATTCGGLNYYGCGTVYNLSEAYATWYKQNHTITSGAWAWVSGASNFTFHSSGGVFYITETISEHNAANMQVLVSKDKNAHVAGILGQTRSDHFNTSYSYHFTTTYGYVYRTHVIEHINTTVAFGEATYGLKKKNASADSFTLTDTNNHTVTTTTSGRHHQKNQYHYNQSILVNHALTFH